MSVEEIYALSFIDHGSWTRSRKSSLPKDAAAGGIDALDAARPQAEARASPTPAWRS
jgi:hypothetical protein